MEYHAVVIGGGVAGAVAALVIARKNLPTLLIEAQSAAVQRKIGETLRPEARPLLQSLGIWDNFVADGHLPCHGNSSVWGSEEVIEKDFLFNPNGGAWQLDRITFEERLISKAREAGAAVMRGRAVDGLERDHARWNLRLGGEVIHTAWVVDATGRRSMAARMKGVKRSILDRMVAVHAIAVSSAGTDRDSRTFIEASEDGWWYSALMPGGYRRVSFQTDADLLPEQEWRTNEWLVGRVHRLRYLSALVEKHRCVFNGRPELTSAHSGYLEAFSGHHWVAAGDAAMSFDPLSGEGIIKAIKSGIEAAEVVVDGSELRQEAFNEWNREAWKDYLKSREDYYAAERRWSDQVFWKRRETGHPNNRQLMR